MLLLWSLNKSSYPSHLLLASLLTPAARYLDLLQGQTVSKAANLHQEMGSSTLCYVHFPFTCLQVALQPQGFSLEEYLDQPHTLTQDLRMLARLIDLTS